MPESAVTEMANANKSDLKPKFVLMLILVLEKAKYFMTS
jgi:hypothetical protein